MKSEQQRLTPEELDQVIRELQSVVPVYRIGKSLADLQQSVGNLKTEDLSLFSRCLYKLYRHADCAREPYAREGDQKWIDQ